MEHTRSLVAALIYVGSIYLSNTFLSALRALLANKEGSSTTHYKFTREDPFVIKTRIVFVSITTFLTYLIFFYVQDCNWNFYEFLKKMQNEHGLIPTRKNWAVFSKEVGFFISLYLMLYSGEILDSLVSLYNSPIKPKFIIQNFISSIDIWFVRNFIFAPITEEIVFTLIIQEDYKNKVKFINSIVYFGIAHLHHGYELYNDDTNGYSLGSIVISCVFQMVYTSFFGHVNNMIYSQKSTYSKVLNCICTHAICNYLGFPSLATNGLYLCSHRISKRVKYAYEGIHLVLLGLGLFIFIKYMFLTN
ncbi:hypothetical protein QEN19_000598 [Hanseniaspora menglaensis]